MGKNSNRRKPATQAQIEQIKVVVRGAMDKIYGDLLLDYAFGNAMSQPSSNDILSEQDHAYVKKIFGLHANISDSLLCLSVLLLCNFRAEEPIEKKFLLRRIVVVCHELYKYLYGFTNKKTEWEVIALKLENKYPEECAELMAQGERYLKKYGQSEDKILRDVSNHYSDKPFEFFKYISTINEKGQTDRALMMIRIVQPLSLLLMKEVGDVLPKSNGDTPVDLKSLTGSRQFKDVFTDELLRETLRHITHRKEIIREQVQRVNWCEKFAAKYGHDMTKDKRWSLLKDDNIVLHIMYLQLDTMILSLAMGRAESSVEEKLILAYMVASMHEGFKKIYGFAESARVKSLWYRYAISRMDSVKDSSLSSEIRIMTGVLDVFSEKDYLKNPTVTLFLSHVGYVRDLGGDSSNAMVDYLLQDDHKSELAGVVGVMRFLNELVNVSGKLLSYENDEMSEDNRLDLEKHLEEIDEMERKALAKVHSEKSIQKLKAQTAGLREMIRRVYNWE